MDFENQKMLEHFFNARQTPLLLRRELQASPAVMDAITNVIAATDLTEDFCLDLLAQMVLYKRTTLPTLVGLLHKHFVAGNPYQRCADALLEVTKLDLVDWDPERDQFILRFDVDADTHNLIRQYQYLPPMIVPPAPVTHNRGSGYLTIATDSLVLQDNHHEGDLALDSLNRFNQIPLAVNIDLVKSIRNEWKHLDRPKKDESFEDYQKRVKAFERYEKDAFFTIALLEEMGNRFHLTHKVDKRGRTYAQGYHINPQGNCWNKACVELADKEIVQ